MWTAVGVVAVVDGHTDVVVEAPGVVAVAAGNFAVAAKQNLPERFFSCPQSPIVSFHFSFLLLTVLLS